MEDTGPGIPPAQRRTVLEPFQTGPSGRSRGGGAGLGLAIVNQLVILHGGTVAIEDAPGGGARIAITLPQPA